MPVQSYKIPRIFQASSLDLKNKNLNIAQTIAQRGKYTLRHNHMDKHGILVIGSSNTDMTVRTERLPLPGETVLGGEFTMGAGGKGANQAVAAKRLGGDVTFVCKVGRDLFGENSVKTYSREGIDTSHIMYSEKPSGIALINVDANAENSISVASGANIDFTPEDIRGLEDIIRKASILLLQLEIPAAAVSEAARIASESGTYVVLNPAPACSLPEETYRHVSLLIPNETEMSQISGIDVHDCKSAEEAAKEMLRRGTGSVIVTLGAKGSLLCRDGKTDFIPSRKVQATDTTAAGDTYCGALCVALSEGKSLEDAARFATAASSIAVTRHGAQESIPAREEVEHVMSGTEQ